MVSSFPLIDGPLVLKASPMSELVDRVSKAIFDQRQKTPMGFVIDGQLARAAIVAVKDVLEAEAISNLASSDLMIAVIRLDEALK